jgi:hypothetical protein
MRISLKEGCSRDRCPCAAIHHVVNVAPAALVVTAVAELLAAGGL